MKVPRIIQYVLHKYVVRIKCDKPCEVPRMVPGAYGQVFSEH